LRATQGIRLEGIERLLLQWHLLGSCPSESGLKELKVLILDNSGSMDWLMGIRLEGIERVNGM